MNQHFLRTRIVTLLFVLLSSVYVTQAGAIAAIAPSAAHAPVVAR